MCRRRRAQLRGLSPRFARRPQTSRVRGGRALPACRRSVRYAKRVARRGRASCPGRRQRRRIGAIAVVPVCVFPGTEKKTPLDNGGLRRIRLAPLPGAVLSPPDFSRGQSFRHVTAADRTRPVVSSASTVSPPEPWPRNRRFISVNIGLFRPFPPSLEINGVLYLRFVQLPHYFDYVFE